MPTASALPALFGANLFSLPCMSLLPKQTRGELTGSAVAWWVRAAPRAVLAAVVVVPLLHSQFAVAVVWPEVIAAVLLAFAFGTASVVGGRSG